MTGKWLSFTQKREHQLHKERLRKAKALVDVKKPSAYISKYGKRQLELKMKEEAISKENYRVVERLLNAMGTKHIDNDNKGRESLLRILRHNANCREKAARQKLMDENLRLLDHIVRAQPRYDHEQWEEDAVKNELVLLNMTEFPDEYPRVRAALSPPIIPRPSTAGMLRRMTFLLPESHNGTLPTGDKTTRPGSGSARGQGRPRSASLRPRSASLRPKSASNTSSNNTASATNLSAGLSKPLFSRNISRKVHAYH